jgi:RNA polymerase sigma-54 factor
MALAAKLQLRQSQSLVMTPQLMQSIRLLQLSHVELERFIDEEIERNPLLERAETREEHRDTANDGPAGETAAPWDGAEPEWSAEAIAGKLDSSLENMFPDDPGRSDRIGPELATQWKSAAGMSSGASEGFDFDEMAASPVTLRDHVHRQIALAFPHASRGAVQGMVARELAEWLDESGYLRADLANVAERLGVAPGEVEAVLATCQTFDPPGLFSRDLAECLSLQLKQRDRLDPAMRALVGSLDLLARRDFAALKRLCGVDEEDLIAMLAEIRSLDPRPGLAFSGGSTQTIVADVEVRAAPGGGWTVELNADTLPRVLVDQTYFAHVAGRARDAQEKDFLSECLNSANWLTRSLDQRAKTILKVATEIVRQQDGFLAFGVQHLKPLNLRMVADAIGMHESTVSRVTSGKYMLTPRGIFELRYFFTASIASADGTDAHSSEAVRDRIRRMIDDEKPVDVLSDDAIVDMLRESGIDIARRTVAKYREGMSIPSSVQRRREKRALALAGR